MRPSAIHFISIGGSAMHSLAIALHQQGFLITGSDDEIHDPSLTNLKKHGLLPAEIGWFPDKIHSGLSAIILGMHARKDNPELAKALELELPIYSYPEYVYLESQQKQRIVIAGSHGKTTITAMIMHVLGYHNRIFDYLVGAQVEGFETTVRLTSNAPIIIIEGDEYACSSIDSRPKFLHYQPHIALISGIAWDHVSIYPTWDEYVDQFESLAEAMPKAGILVFDESDDMLDVIGQKERVDIVKIPYEAHPFEIVGSNTSLITKQGERVRALFFGEHNMKNIAGAMAICDRLGVTEDMFYQAIKSFKGVAGRLERLAENNGKIVFRDFAYAPSKIEAAINAVKIQYPGQQLLIAIELQTINNLNKNFLEHYENTLRSADIAVVYINSETLTNKNSAAITTKQIIEAFKRPDLYLFTNTQELELFFSEQYNNFDVLFLLSSSKFIQKLL